MADWQFGPGEVIQLRIEFTQGERVQRVTATFEHVEDPDAKIILSGIPNRQPMGRWLADLSARVTDSHKRGNYECKALEAEYAGGGTVPFSSGRLNMRFGIIENRMPQPFLRHAEFRWVDPPFPPWHTDNRS